MENRCVGRQLAAQSEVRSPRVCLIHGELNVGIGDRRALRDIDVLETHADDLWLARIFLAELQIGAGEFQRSGKRCAGQKLFRVVIVLSHLQGEIAGRADDGGAAVHRRVAQGGDNALGTLHGRIVDGRHREGEVAGARAAVEARVEGERVHPVEGHARRRRSRSVDRSDEVAVVGAGCRRSGHGDIHACGVAARQRVAFEAHSEGRCLRALLRDTRRRPH